MLVTKPVMLDALLPMVTAAAVIKVPLLLRLMTPLVPDQLNVVVLVKRPPLSISNPPPLPRMKVALVKPTPVPAALLVTISHALPPAPLEMASVPSDFGRLKLRILV